MESVQQSIATKTETETETETQDIKLPIEEQPQRKVFAILDDAAQSIRGHSTCIFANSTDTLGDALRKLNEQQAIAVWGFHIGFVGITTKDDRQVRGGHLLKSSLDLNINDVMLEEDYLVVCPAIDNIGVKSEVTSQTVSEAAALVKHNLYTETPIKQDGKDNDGVQANVALSSSIVKYEEDKSGKWSPEEDEKLIAGLLKYGTKWSQIRKEFDLSYRSAFSLSKRSRRKTLQFRLQRARNLQYENNISQLKAAGEAAAAGQPTVFDPNAPDAKSINQALTLDQPKMGLLDMALDDATVYRKRNWSAEEDVQLIDGIKKFGQKWTTIYRECNFQHRSLPALAKRARKKSFQSLFKKNKEGMDNCQFQLTSAPMAFKTENENIVQGSAPLNAQDTTTLNTMNCQYQLMPAPMILKTENETVVQGVAPLNAQDITTSNAMNCQYQLTPTPMGLKTENETVIQGGAPLNAPDTTTSNAMNCQYQLTPAPMGLKTENETVIQGGAPLNAPDTTTSNAMNCQYQLTPAPMVLKTENETVIQGGAPLNAQDTTTSNAMNCQYQLTPAPMVLKTENETVVQGGAPLNAPDTTTSNSMNCQFQPTPAAMVLKTENENVVQGGAPLNAPDTTSSNSMNCQFQPKPAAMVFKTENEAVVQGGAPLNAPDTTTSNAMHCQFQPTPAAMVLKTENEAVVQGGAPLNAPDTTSSNTMNCQFQPKPAAMVFKTENEAVVQGGAPHNAQDSTTLSTVNDIVASTLLGTANLTNQKVTNITLQQSNGNANLKENETVIQGGAPVNAQDTTTSNTMNTSTIHDIVACTLLGTANLTTPKVTSNTLQQSNVNANFISPPIINNTPQQSNCNLNLTASSVTNDTLEQSNANSNIPASLIINNALQQSNGENDVKVVVDNAGPSPIDKTEVLDQKIGPQ